MQKIIDIKDVGELVNMEAMPKGLNCRFLECYPSHHEPPKMIASQWRRLMPKFIPPGYVVVDFNNQGGK